MSTGSRIGVDLGPDLLYLLALDLGLLAVRLCSLEALGAEAHVDGVLGLVAHADGLVEEAARMALLEGIHDLLAGCAAKERCKSAVAEEAARHGPSSAYDDATSPALTPAAELQVQYSNYKNILQQLAQKIGDVEQETEEHKLVLETLEPLPEDRKCFRMINGVLVERTVKDVIPALKTNSEGLKKVLDDLLKQYKAKQEEMDKWKKKNNIQVVQQ
ncbi:Prefoldin beta-like protein [Neofusicoccum parvum]|nr:Prefoldin beta-like protein [Neofusicoccum parvum]